ncbi:MAG: hypothetical protein HY774_25310 [Acidobacteria bacterium]|nr:hypothetical protein [Acidobacteriota bacterium]
MSTPLVPIQIPSIYKKNGIRVPLPARMAKCAPDMLAAIRATEKEVEQAGGNLYLSDLFRSYEMQLGSHLDYVKGKKSAFSPPPGGSMHEAGRALDLDLDALNMKLSTFWEIASHSGLVPIISTPNASKSEAWHFDCRGSHDRVYQYYSTGKASNMKPYTAMAVSGILAIDVQVDRFKSKQTEAKIQAALIRLGFDPGAIDGDLGNRSKAALSTVGIAFTTPAEVYAALDTKLREAFPTEFAIDSDGDGIPDADDEFDHSLPGHIIQ